MLVSEFPFGSGLFLKLLGWRLVSRFISSFERQGRSANLFVHNWQLFEEPREARRDRLHENLRNPLSIPYSFNVLKEFKRLLKAHEFGRMDGVLGR